MFKAGRAHAVSKSETLNYTGTLHDFQKDATSLWVSEEVELRPLHAHTRTLLMDKNYSWFTDVSWVLIPWTHEGAAVGWKPNADLGMVLKLLQAVGVAAFFFVPFKAPCLFQIWKSNEQWKTVSFVCLFFALTSKECYLRMRFMNTASKSFHQRALTRNMTGARITFNLDK